MARYRPQFHTALRPRGRDVWVHCLGCLLLLVKGAQGSGMDLLPLCLRTRAQKSGGLSGGRGDVGELVTSSENLSHEENSFAVNGGSLINQATHRPGFQFPHSPRGKDDHPTQSRGREAGCVSGPACPPLEQGGRGC